MCSRGSSVASSRTSPIGFVTIDGWCVIRDPDESAADRHLILEAITIDEEMNLQALLADEEADG